jgi:FdhD protein
MGIPILVSRSASPPGASSLRASHADRPRRGERFVTFSDAERVVFDRDLSHVEETSTKHRRKAAMHDD